MKRFFMLARVCAALTGSVAAKPISWVEFDTGTAALEQALTLDEQSHETERPMSWISILALASTHHGGTGVTSAEVRRAAEELKQDVPPEQFLGGQAKYYTYYKEALEAVLGGLVGNYAIQKSDGSWSAAYGLKAYSPIAAGYGYGHYADFGVSRSYGFARRHLGNDLMGGLGTPIIAVEGGTVEAMGWNQYGGWRVGIRSFDRKRYYYYAHLRKNDPFSDGLREGDTVQAGDVIGFMGRTGYSTHENVNNINQVHLHFGLQLIFDESQKECNSEIWVDAYDLVNLLEQHRSTVQKDETTGCIRRAYAYRDLDREALPTE